MKGSSCHTYYCHSATAAAPPSRCPSRCQVLSRLAWHYSTEAMTSMRKSFLWPSPPTETCPYCLIAIRDNTITIGQAVRSVQLDRLRVIRRGISASWLMQEERGTCALPSLAVHQVFCRKQTGHPITREPHKTRRRRDSRIVGQPRGMCQSPTDSIRSRFSELAC